MFARASHSMASTFGPGVPIHPGAGKKDPFTPTKFAGWGEGVAHGMGR